MLSRFRTLLLLLALNVCAEVTRAQLPPSDPVTCNANPNFRFSVSGNTTMVLSNLTDFLNPQSISFSIDVESNNNSYKVYIAGVVTGVSGAESTLIPLNSFTVSASNSGGTQIPAITLNENYQVVVAAGKAKSRTHQITLTRAPLSTFTQAPGTHTVLLHIRICQD